jgi:adenosylhomocysteine nucleosidase
MTGVVCPSVFEYRALDKKALAKKNVRLVLSGMGKLRAMHACARLHREHPGLERILLVGFCGGLTANLKVGTPVEPSVFVEQDYYAEPFEKFPNVIRKKGARLLGGSVDAVMLTQDRFLTENPHARGPYAKKFKKVACDMESYAVAYYCTENRIPFSVVKLVSDSADSSADHDFLRACRALSPKLNRTVQTAVAAARADFRFQKQPKKKESK